MEQLMELVVIPFGVGVVIGFIGMALIELFRG